MIHEIEVPATIKEQFEILMPYVVGYRPLIRLNRPPGWELRLRVPEGVFNGAVDEQFLDKHRLTLEISQDEIDFTREYITMPRRDYDITLTYNY